MPDEIRFLLDKEQQKNTEEIEVILKSLRRRHRAIDVLIARCFFVSMMKSAKALKERAEQERREIPAQESALHNVRQPISTFRRALQSWYKTHPGRQWK